MPVGLACLLLVLDLATLALLPQKLRRKKSTRTAVICVCSVIAIALAGYLLLTAIFLDAAYHH